MNIFLDHHQEVLKRLLENQVDFLLIGGYAVIYHGYERTTGDMDIWLRPVNENKQNLINALQAAGYDKDDVQQLSDLDFTKHAAFSISEEPQRMDFITIINQVSFDEAYMNKVVFELEGLKVPIINLNELILSKMNTGRKKDEADVEELQKRLNFKKR